LAVTAGGVTAISAPVEVAAVAKRGLANREKYGRGGTLVGARRASQLANRDVVSIDTIKRMVSYFARHEVDKQGEGWGVDSKGYQAWLMWGGDPGRAWALRILRAYNREKQDE
jgi:hypothetical protein